MRYLGQDHSAAAYNLLMPTQIRFHRTGGPDVLQYDEVPSRKLETGEVRLKVEAIGLNRAEVMFREGQYTEAPILPSSLGYEAAGVIQEVGPGLDGLKPGDRVATIPAFSMKIASENAVPSLIHTIRCGSFFRCGQIVGSE
jgi:NADPH:quinone reductase-like Zn-dependent oxidoreductase